MEAYSAWKLRLVTPSGLSRRVVGDRFRRLGFLGNHENLFREARTQSKLVSLLANAQKDRTVERKSLDHRDILSRHDSKTPQVAKPLPISIREAADNSFCSRGNL